MTVKDDFKETISGPMAKRQKTNSDEPSVKDNLNPGGSNNDGPSDIMAGIIIAATRTPDMNIVEFSDDISDVEITPPPEPLSDSDLFPRKQKEKKKKKNHTKGEKPKKLTADSEKSQTSDSPSDSGNVDASDSANVDAPTKN